jgi:hypothetical protein
MKQKIIEPENLDLVQQWMKEQVQYCDRKASFWQAVKSCYEADVQISKLVTTCLFHGIVPNVTFYSEVKK